MLDDFRSALRQLRRRPAIALVAALSLALGAGATAAIFGYLQGFYMRPLAVPRSGELVRIFGATGQQAYGGLSYPEYRAVRGESRALASLAVAQRRGALWTAAGETQDVNIQLVSQDFFQALEVRPALGRLFGPGEDDDLVVVLGHGAWQRLFGGDPGIVGRAIRLSRGSPQNVRVAGILPPEFRDLAATGDQHMWIPPATFAALSGGDWREFEDWENAFFDVIGRLRPKAEMRQLHAELETITGRLAQSRPQSNARRRLVAMTDLNWRLHIAGRTGWALLLMVVLVVAISCVNVSNLLLAGVEGRRREIATRAALGATRGRLVRQLLLESLVIGVAGTAAGLVLGQWLIAALPALIGLAPEYRSAVALGLDPAVFWGTVAAALGTALFFGLAPALSGSRTDLVPALRNSAGARSRRFPVRRCLAISQLALSLVLLVTAGVLARSFWNARFGDIGIGRKNVLAVWKGRGPASLERPTLERLAALPGVRDVAVAFRAPLSGSGGGMAMSLTLPGHPEFPAAASPVRVKFNSVDGRYFGILGIPLLRGRLFTDADTDPAQPVAVISAALAQRYWPEADPIGRHLRAAPDGPDYLVVGIVADAPINTIGELPEPYFYTSWWQNPFGEHTLLVETRDEPSARAPAIRAALAELRPAFKRAEVSTMDSLIRDKAHRHRAPAMLVASLALLGLALSVVGFYGVTAYGVSLRKREIGIRMAVGARTTDAAMAVVRHALATAAIGIAAGLPCSLAATRALASTLFGVAPWYAPALLGGSAVMLAAAAAAALIPAMAAARLDPLAVLRHE